MNTPDSFVPCRREMNWFLDEEEKEKKTEQDITNHPDKYVQAEVN